MVVRIAYLVRIVARLVVVVTAHLVRTVRQLTAAARTAHLAKIATQ